MKADSLVSLERDNTPEEKLRNKIAILAKSVWKDRWGNESDTLTPWVQNFDEDEKNRALYMLSHFIYFDSECIREMLVRSYEDFVRKPIIESIRRQNGNTLNEELIETEYDNRLKRIRFLCLGNPSESSAMLLYFFRQENNLPMEQFISVDRLFEHKEENDKVVAILKSDDIDQIIVLDDFCASGSQAKEFSQKYVTYIKKQSTSIKVKYIALVGTLRGKNIVEQQLFDKCDYCITLDNSYRVFSESARYFRGVSKIGCNKEDILSMCQTRGQYLNPNNPKGYKDGQLMIGFFHNTPNNTLPIFWSENRNWKPIFKRYNKKYSL